MSKAFVPTKTLQRGGVTASTCWYNKTIVETTVWTRAPANYPAGTGGLPRPVNATRTFAVWPFRFEMSQRQAPAPDVPDCRALDGRPLGPGLAATAPGSVGDCVCLYRNFGLGG